MKVSKNKNLEFSKEEIEVLKKVPLSFKLKVLWIVLSFFTLFPALTLVIIGATKGNNVLIVVAAILGVIGIFFLIVAIITSKPSKSLIRRYKYQYLHQILKTDSIEILDENKIDKNMLINSGVAEFLLDEFDFRSNYAYEYNGCKTQILNVKRTSLGGENKKIARALNLSTPSNTFISGSDNYFLSSFVGLIIKVDLPFKLSNDFYASYLNSSIAPIPTPKELTISYFGNIFVLNKSGKVNSKYLAILNKVILSYDDVLIAAKGKEIYLIFKNTALKIKDRMNKSSFGLGVYFEKDLYFFEVIYSLIEGIINEEIF